MNTFRWLALAFLIGPNSPAADLRIVCFGDSTTAPRAGVVPYCDQIRESGIDTLNRGVPGNTTEAARLRFSKDVLDAKPNLVIMQFGINDSTVDVWKTPPATTTRVSVTRFHENLSYFIAELQAINARIILMTFNPLAWTPKMLDMYGKPPYNPESPTGFNNGRGPYLQAIRDLAAQNNLTLLDIDKDFRSTDVSDLLLDGIHPNTKAHERIAALLRPHLHSRR